MDNSNERRKQWIKAHPELVAKPSMKRRMVGHDYNGVAIYMVTLCVEGRRPLLGELRGPDDRHARPWVYPSPVGQERLWEEGYNDRILHSGGQLDRWIQYLIDNPRRLWIKRNHPDLFLQQTDIVIGSTPVVAMGNRSLLDYPEKVEVRCSRRLSEADIDHECQRYLSMAREGAVLVSPCISPGEKEVMGTAFEAGYPLIVLIENGFSPYQKPSGRQFDACSQGRLLIVAPWPHHDDYRKITKKQCEELNALARHISDNSWYTSK